MQPATPINRGPVGKISLRSYLLLFTACLLFHAAGSWTLPLIDRDEPRFAEASREMLQRGDYVVPYFNDHYRFDKPPLTYWFQCASYRLFGENDFAARLPSAIAAALTALVVLAWGRRVASPRVGWWAAIIFTICWQTIAHAKAAVADMWLVLFVTLAHWAGYELLRDRLRVAPPASTPHPRPSRAWWWIFYLALAFAFLAKGPIGWTPLLAVAATKFFLPGLHLQRRFLFITGMLLALALIAIWGIPALVRTNGAFFSIGIGKHVIDRSLVAMQGHGAGSIWTYLVTLPFYFLAIFVTFFPWSFQLPWLGKRLWRERDPLDNYLIAGVAVIFVIFTLVKTKLPHYTLPAFPLLALLLAKALQGRPDANYVVRRGAIGAGCLALLLIACSPLTKRFVPALQLVRRSQNYLTPETQFGALRYKEPTLVWYFRKQLHGFLMELDEEGVKPFMDAPGPRFVILPTEIAQRMYPVVPKGWKKYTARGLNVARLKPVTLTMLLKRS
ncbi:MAG: ArnT family glycosyltransferase [Chthoniobacterales bacterium]